MRAAVDALPADLAGTRDRAVLLLGFAAALRRSELVGLDTADVEAVEAGLVLSIRRSTTDQEGYGRAIGVPFGAEPRTCPVGATTSWMAAIDDGPLFRPLLRNGRPARRRLSAAAVNLIVKRALSRAGLDATGYSGHSLRAGFATAAAAAGVPERDIFRQTGHRSATAGRRYIRDGELFRDHPVGKVGL